MGSSRGVKVAAGTCSAGAATGGPVREDRLARARSLRAEETRRTSSGTEMQHAREPAAEKTVEVVRNHGGGTGPIGWHRSADGARGDARTGSGRSRSGRRRGTLVAGCSHCRKAVWNLCDRQWTNPTRGRADGHRGGETLGGARRAEPDGDGAWCGNARLSGSAEGALKARMNPRGTPSPTLPRRVRMDSRSGP